MFARHIFIVLPAQNRAHAASEHQVRGERFYKKIERCFFCCSIGLRTVFLADDRCNLPLAVGEGPHKLGRFYYNAFARRCSEFTYGGFNGNENQFVSADECQRRCLSAFERELRRRLECH